jgi:hypothetical protein
MRICPMSLVDVRVIRKEKGDPQFPEPNCVLKSRRSILTSDPDPTVIRDC